MGGHYICSECIEDMPTCELVSMFGYEMKTAGAED